MKKLLILIMAIFLTGCEKDPAAETFTLNVKVGIPNGTEYRINAGDGKPQRTVSKSDYTEDVQYMIGSTASISVILPQKDKMIGITVTQGGKVVASTTESSLVFTP